MSYKSGIIKDNQRTWFEKLSSILEQNIRGVQIGIYAVALTGLVIAVRSVRPFKKFIHPMEIPSSFCRKHVTLSGKVLKIDLSQKPLLVVDHTPLIGSSFRSLSSGLPVNLDSIDISLNGISWLQSLVVGQKVEFVVLSRAPSSISCIVRKDKKTIANSLVSLGFASVGTFNMDLESDNLYIKYYRSLLKDEMIAERNGAGMWWEHSPTIRRRVLNIIYSKMSAIKQIIG